MLQVPRKYNNVKSRKKEITFLKQNKSPFYSVKTGNVSGYNDVAFLLLTLIKSKSNGIAQSIDDIQSKLSVPSNAGSMATTNSFIMAHNLLKLHFYMLEGAVKCLAQS